jgi:hypothetical protein
VSLAILERFWSKVDQTAGPDGCWPWLGPINDYGYGEFWLGRSPHYPVKQKAHRFAFEMLTGPIPEGLTLDHLCHNEDADCEAGDFCRHRRCVNPRHLTPTTIRENVLGSDRTPAAKSAAKTHCPQGHPYSGSNLAITSKGFRRCRICARRRYPRKVAA